MSFLNFSGFDLQDQHPKCICFIGSNFENTKFKGCLCCTDFRYASLKNADFSQECEDRASMNFKGANFTGARLDGLSIYRKDDDEKDLDIVALIKKRGGIFDS